MNEKDIFDSMSKYELSSETQDCVLIERLIDNLVKGRHTILVGPPGTGKTRLLNIAIKNLSGEGKIGNSKLVQFHPQYTYQDFIEGYTVKEGKFDYKSGVFKEFIKNCKNDQLNIFAIDEINRADISSVFGELLSLLDSDADRKITLPISNDDISIPNNLVVVGTMNSADKNIAIMDFALRRRFSFIFVGTDYQGLKKWISSHGIDSERISIDTYIRAIKNINARIISHPLLGKNMALGQSLFVPKLKSNEIISENDIHRMFSELVIPQLETYFGFGPSSDLAEILTPAISAKQKYGVEISVPDVLDLICSLSESKESDENDD